MSFVVPDALEIELLNNFLVATFTIKLYGNNVTPTHLSTAASFTEIAGGGYTNFQLLTPNWTVVSGDPSYAVYNTTQTWTFTGPINAPGTIYGYFVTRNSDSKLMWAELFGSGVIPFNPVAGSVIKVLPKFQMESAF